MKIGKAAACLIALSLAVVLMSGCVRHYELDEIAITEAVGIDLDSDGYTVTVQYFNTDASGGVTAVDSSAPNVITVSGRGETVESALRSASYISGKHIMLGSAGIVVFGREAASDDLRGSLAFIASNYSGDPKTYVAAAEDKASDILNVKFTEGNASVVKLEYMTSNALRLGLARPVRLYEALDDLSGETSGLVLPLLRVTDSGSDFTDDGKSVIISGGMILVEGSVSGIMDTEEMSGLLLLSGAYGWDRTCTLTPDLGKRTLRAKLYCIDTDITPSFSDGRLHLDILVTADCEYESTDLTDPSSASEKAGRICADEVISRIESALAKTLTGCGADTFGLEYVIRSHSPEMWREVCGDYSSILRKADISVRCDINTERFGIMRGG